MFFLKPIASLLGDEHHHDAVVDESRKIRAQETLDALSNILGITPGPAAAAGVISQQPQWSTQLLAMKPKKELLAEPAIEGPPYNDPSSVLILDQCSLEFELEDDPSPETLTTIEATAASDTPTDISVSLSLSSSVEESDTGVVDETSTSTTTPPTLKSSTSTKIRFASMVSVVEIPSHRDMDPDITTKIWTSTRVTNHNGRRNVVEWNYDHRDWKNATEEDQMVYDAITGEYIHPATWEEMEDDRLYEKQELERMQRCLALAQAEATYHQQPQVMELSSSSFHDGQQQQQELDRMHLALEEAVRRERIRKEANKRLKNHSSSSKTTTSPRSRANLARRKMMRSPQVQHGVKQYSGSSLTRFADT